MYTMQSHRLLQGTHARCAGVRNAQAVAPLCVFLGKCRHVVVLASPSGSTGSSSEFEGVPGDPGLQEALMQQLRVQIEAESLKEEIKEDLKGKVEEMKQIGEEV